MSACGKTGVRMWLSAGVVCGVSGLALGQAEARPVEPAKVLLVVEGSRMSEALVDAKDERLRAALGMLPARLRELPEEVPDMPPQVAEVLDLVLKAAARPARVAISYGAGNPAHGLWGYGLVVSFEAKDEEDAREVQASVNGLLAQSDLPPQFLPKESERVKGMADMPLPMGFGLMSYGPRKGVDGWRYELIIGSLDNPDAAFAALPGPMGGVEPVLRGRLDLEQLTPAAQFVMTMAGGKNPEVRRMFGELTKMGVIGPGALKVDFEDGFTPTERLSRVAVRGMKAHREWYGMSEGALSKKELAMIPLSATMASIAKGGLDRMNAAIDQAMEQSPELADGLARFKSETGVDLREDILGSLGETFVAYTSDATGGGSIGSAVFMVALKDRAKFLGAHDKLVAKGNELLSEDPNVRGYVKISPWEEGGIRLHSLRFGGLPIPAEITYGVVGDFLVASLTPQGALAAARQMTGKGDAGLIAHEQFAAAIGGREVTGASYINTERMMLSGYPFVSLVGSAIANGVRSRDGEREPGLVVPPFNELAKGARASVQVMRWEGEDYLIESHGDRSLLVQGAGAAGTVVQFWPVIAAAVGAVAGATHDLRHDLSQGGTWFEPAWAAMAPRSVPMAAAEPRWVIDPARVDRWLEGRWVEDAVEFVK